MNLEKNTLKISNIQNGGSPDSHLDYRLKVPLIPSLTFRPKVCSYGGAGMTPVPISKALTGHDSKSLRMPIHDIRNC